MWTRLWLFVEQHSRTVIIVLPALAFVLGVAGWVTTTDMDWWTAAYRSMALFALDGPIDGHISWQLALARFLAPLTISLAIVAVGLEMLRAQFSVGRAKRLRGHTVVLGSGPESAGIARQVRTDGQSGRVVTVGQLSAQDVAELRQSGVIHLPAPSSSVLAKVLAGADQVVISTVDDAEAIELTAQVQRLRGHESGVITLLSDRELATDWRHTGAGTALCRSARVASSVLRAHPPYLEDAVTPPPTVIGDGRLATELAHRIIGGWQHPGESLTLYCAGTDPAWAHAAQVGLPAEVNLEWRSLYPSGLVAPQVVRESLEKWQRSWGEYKHHERYGTAPARVYVAFDDDTLTLPIANAVARDAASDTHVVAVLDADWPAATRHPSLMVVGRQELLCEPSGLQRTAADDLADEILADLGRWPADVPSVFGPIACGMKLSALDAPIQEAVVALSKCAESILRSAGFEVAAGSMGRPEALLLGPSELVAIAEELAGVVPKPAEGVTPQDQFVRLLELASTLPTLLRRVGRSVVRVGGRADLLAADDVTALAMSAHKGYREVAKATRNASGSVFANAEWEQLTEHERRSNVAQIWDIPVKLATLGLGWEPGPARPSASVAFTDAAIALLAESEHRRWAHFEMRNARHDHQWNLPWAEVKDTDTAEYDRAACVRIPDYLAQVGVRIVPLPDASRSALAGATRPAELEVGDDTSGVEPTASLPPQPRRFKRSGRAWAWQLDAPFEWRTPRGDILLGQSGDWWVIDEHGSARTVAGDSFAATYQQVDAQEYARVGVVTAWQAIESQVVATHEGEASAAPGDWIVTDAYGSRWPVPQEEFDWLYEEDL